MNENKQQNNSRWLPNLNLIAVKNALLGKGRTVAAAVFGDSVMRGVMLDEESQGYRMYRGRFVDDAERYHIDIHNNSRFGFTVKRGAELIHQHITPEDHPAFVFLEYGGNDCNFDWVKVAAAPEEEHEPMVPPDEFVETYSDVLDYVTSCNATPIVMIPAPIDAEKFLTWICRKGLDRKAILHWLGSTDAIYRRQEYYAGLCEKLAEKKGCPVLDLRTPFLCRRDFGELIGADGIHPTEKGHALIDEIFDAFWESIKDEITPEEKE